MFLPSKTASFISLTLGMSYLSYSPLRLRGGVAANLTGWCGCLRSTTPRLRRSPRPDRRRGKVYVVIVRRSSSSEIDFEVAERIHAQRAPRMHDDGGVGRLDDRRPLDRVPRNEECSVE